MASDKVERKVTVILATDVVGYSTKMEKNEDQTLQTIKEKYIQKSSHNTINYSICFLALYDDLTSALLSKCLNPNFSLQIESYLRVQKQLFQFLPQKIESSYLLVLPLMETHLIVSM